MWADKGEIIFCNIHLKDKNKTIVLKEIVTKNIGDKFWHRDLERYKIKSPIEVVKVEIIKSLGRENANQ